MKRCILLAATLVFTLAGSVGPAPQASPLPVVVATPVAGSAAELCITCWEDECPLFYHDAWGDPWGSNDWSYNEGPHTDQPFCRGGTCPDAHGPECTVPPLLTADDLERLRQAVRARDARGIQPFLAAHAGRLAVNMDRSAIQATGCGGAVILHMPVPRDFITSLTTVEVEAVGQ
jgi:hypothetical protein